MKHIPANDPFYTCQKRIKKDVCRARLLERHISRCCQPPPPSVQCIFSTLFGRAAIQRVSTTIAEKIVITKEVLHVNFNLCMDMQLACWLQVTKLKSTAGNLKGTVNPSMMFSSKVLVYLLYLNRCQTFEIPKLACISSLLTLSNQQRLEIPER